LERVAVVLDTDLLARVQHAPFGQQIIQTDSFAGRPDARLTVGTQHGQHVSNS